MTNNLSNSSIRVPQWIMSIVLIMILAILGFIGKEIYYGNKDVDFIKGRVVTFDSTNTYMHSILWKRIEVLDTRVDDVDKRTIILEDRSKRRQ